PGRVARVRDGSRLRVDGAGRADAHSAQAAWLDPGRTGRLRHRANHVVCDILGAALDWDGPPCRAQHLVPTTENHSLDLGAAEVDAAARDYSHDSRYPDWSAVGSSILTPSDRNLSR